MGRLSQLGGAMLGAAVALDAGEALSQSKPELPQKGYFPEDPAELSQYRYALLNKVVMSDDPAEGVRVEAEAKNNLELVRREASQMTTYWELKFLGLDPVGGEPIFEYVRPSIPGKDARRECITTDHYVDAFPIRSTGQTVLVIDRKDQFDHVVCPEPVAATTKVEIVPPPPTAAVITAPEYVPHPGRFADLEPLLVKQGIFLVPVREIGITEEVPAELSGTAYVTQTDQAKGKRVVYRQYVLDNYEPKTGTIRIHDGGNQEQCVETTSYQDKKLGNKTSYILSVPGSPEMREVECKEEAAPKPVVKTQVPTTVKALPQKSKSWKLPVRVGVGVGADREETSEYNLGDAPALHVSAQVQPFAIPLEFGISGDFIFTRDGSGLEGVDLMVGGQPFRAVPVRGYLTVGDSFEVRERYSETTLNGALSYGVLVEGDIYKFTLGGQALALGCNASAQQHLYGGGGLSVWNPAAGCGVVWDTVVSGGGKEKKERPVGPDAAVSAVAVEARPRGPHLEMETKPYSYEIPVFKETKSEEKKASATQRSEAMIKKAQRNAWDGVEEDYNTAIKLKIPLSFKTYMLGAEAARALGNMQECYERILTARSVATTEGERGEADSFLADVAANYSSVEITVKAGGEISFVPSSMPFPPDQRAAVTFAQAELVDGSFEGFIPLILNMDGTQGTYTLNGQTIKFSDLKPVSDQVTTEIRLEK